MTHSVATTRPTITINTRLWFSMFCLIHLIAWTVVPSFVRNNVPFDTIEGIAWGNQWQWGYDKHPPLAAWLSALFTHLGGTVGWPVYLLAQLAVITAFWAVWQLAKNVLPPLSALVSVLLLEGMLYYNLITPKFNPTTLMTPIWALTILAFYYALTQQKIHKWLVFGCLSGLSLLTKYESLMLLIPMVIVSLTTAEGRSSYRSPGIYLSIIVAFFVWLPNLIWLFQHNFTSISYAVTSINASQFKHTNPLIQHLHYPINFSLEQLGALIPVFILALPFYACQRSTISTSAFKLNFFLLLGLGPFALTVFLSLLTGIYLYGKWATPYFSLVGILFMLWIRPIMTRSSFKTFVLLLVILFTLTLSGRYLFLGLGPKLTGNTNPDAYFPGNAIAGQLTQQWHDTYHKPLKYVAGSHYFAANIAAYSSDKPIPYFDWSKTQSAWIDENKLRQEGAIFIWEAFASSHRRLPLDIAKRFPKAKLKSIESFQKKAPIKTQPVLVGVAFLPPAGHSP